MQIPNPRRHLIFWMAGLIMLPALLWYAWQIADRGFLSDREADAVVAEKVYRPVTETTRSERVGNRTHTYPVLLPEAWFVTVEVEGSRGSWEISREQYEAVQAGDRVRAVFSKRRLSGDLTVRKVLGLPGGG